MTLSVWPLLDPLGDPIPLYREGVELAAQAAVATAAGIQSSANIQRPLSAVTTTSVAITASATVSSPVDLTSSLVEGVSTYSAGSLTVPSADQSYRVTVADASFPSYPSPQTRGVRVYLPTPSTPNAAHWLTVAYTLSGYARRVFHDIDTVWLINGDVIEPATSGTTTLNYTWDTTARSWYVSGYTGTPVVRTHGPDESPNALPLFFTPECRALGSFSTIRAAQQNAVDSLPSMIVNELSAVGVVADVMSDQSGNVLETMRAREAFDPAYRSGASGYFDGTRTVNAYPWTLSSGAVDGRTLLHELGHAWDRYALGYIDAPWGVDPSGVASPNEYDTVTTYHPTGEVWVVAQFFPTYFTYLVYDTSGSIINGGGGDRPAFSRFSDEQPIVDLYATVADHPGNYYRSLIQEWTAQCFMLIWADHVPGFNASERNALITDIGGSSVLADFKAYAVSIGVHPNTW